MWSGYLSGHAVNACKCSKFSSGSFGSGSPQSKSNMTCLFNKNNDKNVHSLKIVMLASSNFDCRRQICLNVKIFITEIHHICKTGVISLCRAIFFAMKAIWEPRWEDTEVLSNQPSHMKFEAVVGSST